MAGQHCPEAAAKLSRMARARHHATVGDLPGRGRRDRDSATRRRRRSAAPEVVYQASWHPSPGILAPCLSHSGSVLGGVAEHRRRPGTESRGLATPRHSRCSRVGSLSGSGLEAVRSRAGCAAARGAARAAELAGAYEASQCFRAAAWARYAAAAALRSCVGGASAGRPAAGVGLPISAHKARLRVLPPAEVLETLCNWSGAVVAQPRCARRAAVESGGCAIAACRRATRGAECV